MGLVPNVTVDPVQDIISECRRLSPNIESYFANELYLLDVTTVDLINNTWLKNRALTMLIDEVHELGIVSDLDDDDFIDIPELRQKGESNSRSGRCQSSRQRSHRHSACCSR